MLHIILVGSDEIILKQLKQMETGLNKIKTELKNLKTPQNSDDKFFEKMEVSITLASIYVQQEYVYFFSFNFSDIL